VNLGDCRDRLRSDLGVLISIDLRTPASGGCRQIRVFNIDGDGNLGADDCNVGRPCPRIRCRPVRQNRATLDHLECSAPNITDNDAPVAIDWKDPPCARRAGAARTSDLVIRVTVQQHVTSRHKQVYVRRCAIRVGAPYLVSSGGENHIPQIKSDVVLSKLPLRLGWSSQRRKITQPRITSQSPHRGTDVRRTSIAFSTPRTPFIANFRADNPHESVM
jgi:hypothetical protein